MAFKLTKTNNFKTPVEVVTPLGDGTHKWKFTAEFKVFVKDDNQPEVKDFLDNVLVSVEGVPVDDGIQQDEVIEMLKARPDTRNALISAYNKALVKKNQTSNLF